MQPLKETLNLNEMIGKGLAYSPQDVIEKTKTTTGKHILETLDRGYFDWDECNLWGTGEIQEMQKLEKLGQEDATRIYNTVKALPLHFMLKEFLAKSSSTGISGAAYLIPVKIYQVMSEYAVMEDILEAVSMTVLPAEQLPGATHQVDYAVSGSYAPHKFSSGAKQPEEEIKYGKVTLDFTAPWGIHFNLGNDLIEDSQFNLIEQHVRMAGKEMGKYSTTQVLTVMALTNDGDGTMNTVAATEDAATMAQIWNAVQTNIVDEWISDRILCPSELLAATFADTTFSAYSTDFHNAAIRLQMVNFFGLDWIRCEHELLWDETAHLPTDCLAYVFSKNYSYISGRKRWLRMENYSDPVRDLIGATITARQDTCSVYDDSVCQIIE